MSKSFAFWALIAAVILTCLQFVPDLALLTLLVGGPFMIAMLIHVFLISLFIEAAIGRAPRGLMAIPIAAYGGYYALYLSEGFEIAKRVAEIRKLNPGKLVDFDPARDAFVGKDQGHLVQRYEIPVVYEPNDNIKPEGYLSYRLVRSDQCRALGRDSQSRIMIMDVSRNSGVPANRRFPVCVLRFPDKPEGRILTVTKVDDPEIWKRKPGLTEQITDLTANGKVIGSYRSAFVWRLQAFPMMLIGCTVLTSKRECDVAFLRDFQTVETVPDSVDKTKYNTAESVMLGFRKYTDKELEDFKGFASNEPALVRAAAEPKRVEDETYTTLERILDGEPVKPVWAMAYALTRDPERLAPYGERMAKRLAEVWDPNLPADLRDTAGVLATAIATLPPAEFQKIADAVFGLVQQRSAPSRSPALYLRAADAGPQTLDFYKDEILKRKDKTYLSKLPVLAICRIGVPDAQIIAELKRLFEATDDKQIRNEDLTALFVTLVKFGQEDFLRGKKTDWRDTAWAEAVLEGRGLTTTGPNNCMSKEWGYTEFLGPVMQPSLSMYNGRWDMRPAK